MRLVYVSFWSSLTPCLFPSCCLQAILRPTYCRLLMPVGISVMITFAQSGSVISIQQAPASQPPEKNVILWGWLCIYFHARCFTIVSRNRFESTEFTHCYCSCRSGLDSRQLWGDGLLVLLLFFESFFAREPYEPLVMLQSSQCREFWIFQAVSLHRNFQPRTHVQLIII